MSDTTVIRNARLPRRAGLYQISIEAGMIGAIAPMEALGEASNGLSNSAAEVIDVASDWISLGAVDLQINGALGLAFPDLRLRDLARLQEICHFLWAQGVDGFCPTIVTTSLENIHGSLKAIRAFQRQLPKAKSAQILGVHLEGPFLNEAKRGAHPAEFLQPLTLDTVKAVIGEFADGVSIVTLAPELAAQETVIQWLVQQGITVSLGHSLATAEQAGRAFDQGATMVTHAFNAMPALHHRHPGLLGAALTDSRVLCGFIADGQHICPKMLDVLLRLARGGSSVNSSSANMEGLFLVSDALSPLGLPDGRYPWDDREIEVVNGTARLADGTLSGTTLSLIAGAQNLVAWGLCEAEEAIALVTSAPREAIGLPGLAVGQPAQLLRWHQAGAEITAHRLVS
ncbi:MAG: N-acetylglucosamine-6-phosphate deacetylase [Cyanobacteria bacterium J06623_5]